jgi:hypothetical protein
MNFERRAMRILLVVILLTTAGWGGYWYVAAGIVERSAEAWLERQGEAGPGTGHAGVAVGGFPRSFDLEVTEPRYSDPVAGIGWEAPWVRLMSAAYSPNHITAELPASQKLLVRDDVIELNSADLRAGLSLRLDTALALATTSLAGEALVFRSDHGWQVGLDKLRFETRQQDGQADRHEVSLELEGLAPDGSWLDVSQLAPPPPDSIERLALDATLAFDKPLDRLTLENPQRPRLTHVTINDARVLWGDMLIWADGDLAVDPMGVPEGQILFRARNWQEMLDVVVAAGFVHPEVAQTWARVLDMLEAESETPGVLDVPLRFEDGRMRLGPLPLGAAPRLSAS